MKSGHKLLRGKKVYYAYFKRIWARKNQSIWVREESAGAAIRSDVDSSARVHECMCVCVSGEAGGEVRFGLLNDSQVRSSDESVSAYLMGTVFCFFYRRTRTVCAGYLCAFSSPT